MMASQALLLQNPTVLFPCNPTAPYTALPRKPSTVSFHSALQPLTAPSTPKLPPLVSFSITKSPKIITSSSSTSTSQNPDLSPPPPSQSSSLLLTSSTRTVTTLLVITLAVSKLFANKILDLAVRWKAIHRLSPQPLIYSAGPAFFAAISDHATAVRLDTPFTILAVGMAKWLDIYIGVLSIRCLLTWFPNIPWDRQPLSAMRDLSDPYLSIFRSIIPPVFDSLDLSPLVAFTVLGILGTILRRF